MNKANLFIMGGPKCGTTSLASWLSQHSEIYLASTKEPRFFNSDWNLPNRPVTLEEYQKFFIAARGEAWLCDGTTGYLASEVAASAIKEYNPDARYLVCLRNPIDMAFSLHAQRLKEGIENEENFWTAWNLQKARVKFGLIPARFSDYRQVQYGSICKTGYQTERLLATVDPRAVCLIDFNDLAENPGSVLERIFVFLDLEPEADISFEHENKSRAPKSSFVSRLSRVIGVQMKNIGLPTGWGVQTRINRLNQVAYRKPRLDEEQFCLMLDWCEKDMVKLEKLLGRRFPEWRLYEEHLK